LINSLDTLQKLYLGDVNISVSASHLAHATSTNTTSGLKELIVKGMITGRFDTVLVRFMGLTHINNPNKSQRPISAKRRYTIY